MKGKLGFVITLIVLYLVSTGVSYGIFRTVAKDVLPTTPETINPGEGFQVDDSAPKTEACPLNGKLYTKQEKAVWEKRRPMAVMMENSVDARPHSGLSKADIVYEAVAEGGITRFMGMFYCGIAEETLFAPVRSVRTYFVDWVSEYAKNPILVHVGGANCGEQGGRCVTDKRAQAIEQIESYGWRGVEGNDMDQIANISFPICYKNPDRIGRTVATEHTMVCNSELLHKEAAKRGWAAKDEEGTLWSNDYTPWKFKEEAKSESRGTVNKIDMYWWKGQPGYTAQWEYDNQNNEYKRSTGNEPHMDLEANTQLTAKNVVVQFSEETSLSDPGKHMLYKTIGSGDALIFMDGNVIEGSWSKKSRTARTIFTDDKGKEVIFNPGVIWIEIIPDGNTVTY